MAKKYGVILCAAEADEFLLQNMVRQCESFGIPFRGEIQPIGHYISDKDTFDLGHEKLKTIAIPGHSPGSMAFYAPDSGFVLSGDALFQMSQSSDFSGLPNEKSQQWKNVHGAIQSLKRFLLDHIDDSENKESLS